MNEKTKRILVLIGYGVGGLIVVAANYGSWLMATDLIHGFLGASIMQSQWLAGTSVGIMDIFFLIKAHLEHRRWREQMEILKYFRPTQ